MYPEPRKRALNENEEEEKTQELADLLAAVKCLLVNGEKRAAILLIEKVFPDNACGV